MHPGIGAIAASLTVNQIRALSEHDSVASISTDAVVLADQTTTSTYTRARNAGTAGSVAGRQSHRRRGHRLRPRGRTRVRDRIVGFYDFTRGGIAAPPSDDYGHGTHVAGLIAGNGDARARSGTAASLRRRALIALKVLDRKRRRDCTSDVISAIEFATANKDRLGIDIINLSLGHPILEPAATDPLVQAVEAAVRAGIVVVASAGNYGLNPETAEPGYAGIVSPGERPVRDHRGCGQDVRHRRSAATIGWLAYSSRGPTWYDGIAKPDLVAPGHGLVSVARARSSTLYIEQPVDFVSATLTCD